MVGPGETVGVAANKYMAQPLAEQLYAPQTEVQPYSAYYVHTYVHTYM